MSREDDLARARLNMRAHAGCCAYCGGGCNYASMFCSKACADADAFDTLEERDEARGMDERIVEVW